MYTKADKLTMYFIGVTTGKSSIMKVFPEWAKYLGIGECPIRGMDFKPHDEPEAYREAVKFIKGDELSQGALVTTHKIGLLKACRDLFDELDPHADFMGEVSSISKIDGKLIGHAKDPISSGLSLDAFLPANHWADTGAEALVLGAGGSSIAITWHMMQEKHGANQPSKIIVTNRSLSRLEEIEAIHKQLNSSVPVEYHHCPAHEDNDMVMSSLKPGSVVMNATGLGKDGPGSPFTDDAVFPERGIVWDFNYRGNLVFLDQARAQEQSKSLQIEDGWVYFIHGWTRVIAEVFHIDIPTNGPVFDELCNIAACVR
ncbi:MAG: shikimate dehydrogenase family protein [Armatimonadota bacterium]